MKKVLAITLILAVLLASTILVTPSTSALVLTGDAKGCCSYDQSISTGCQQQSYMKWKQCEGHIGDWLDSFYGIDW